MKNNENKRNGEKQPNDFHTPGFWKQHYVIVPVGTHDGL